MIRAIQRTLPLNVWLSDILCPSVKELTDKALILHLHLWYSNRAFILFFASLTRYISSRKPCKRCQWCQGYWGREEQGWHWAQEPVPDSEPMRLSDTTCGEQWWAQRIKPVIKSLCWASDRVLLWETWLTTAVVESNERSERHWFKSDRQIICLSAFTKYWLLLDTVSRISLLTSLGSNLTKLASKLCNSVLIARNRVIND